MKSLELRYAQGRFGRFAPSASVEISAPLEKVWGILADFESYPEWNCFTSQVECSGVLGSTVEMMVSFPGSKPFPQTEVLNAFEPPYRLAWGMKMGNSAVLVANRYQTLEQLGESRTRYTTVDYVSGLLAPLVRMFYAQSMISGFELAAAGLKARAEKA